MITGNETAMPEIITEADFADVNREKTYGNTYSYGGLTIRQEFAARAMQGWLSGYPNYEPSPEEVASKAVQIADALIEELNKPK